jgi:hypothetical protein
MSKANGERRLSSSPTAASAGRFGVCSLSALVHFWSPYPMLDSGELGLVGFLVGVCALSLLFTRWVVKYFPRGRVFFGLIRDGVVIGSLLGRKYIFMVVDRYVSSHAG